MIHHLLEAKIHRCIKDLQAGYRSIYGVAASADLETVTSVANKVLHWISKSDAPYHDLDHTILVTLAGLEILKGKHVYEGNVSSQDWQHTMISLLCHDIGYIKGVCQADQVKKRLFTTGQPGEMIHLPLGSTDASLTPYHIDRGKRFIQEFFVDQKLVDIDVVQNYIELTRFPVPNDEEHRDTWHYPGLVRAADLVGQLADPLYLDKMTQLFLEFEEVGTNQYLGYHEPDDIRAAYPGFFRNVVYQYIQDSLVYLEVTSKGQNILYHLYQNVRIVEQELQELKQKKAEWSEERVKISRESCAAVPLQIHDNQFELEVALEG